MFLGLFLKENKMIKTLLVIEILSKTTCKELPRVKGKVFFNRMSYSVYRLQIIDKNIGVEK